MVRKFSDFLSPLVGPSGTQVAPKGPKWHPSGAQVAPEWRQVAPLNFQWPAAGQRPAAGMPKSRENA